jgi:hypothetical protein
MGGDGSFGSGDYHLTEGAAADVPGGEETRDRTGHALIRDDIACFVGFYIRDEGGLRGGSGEDEYCADRLFVPGFIGGVFQQY